MEARIEVCQRPKHFNVDDSDIVKNGFQFANHNDCMVNWEPCKEEKEWHIMFQTSMATTGPGRSENMKRMDAIKDIPMIMSRVLDTYRTLWRKRDSLMSCVNVRKVPR